MGGDYVLQPDERVVSNLGQVRLGTLLYVVFVGDAYQAWEHIFHFDAGKALPPQRIIDDHGQVETEIRDVREWMRRIESQRRQHRKNVAREILRHKRPLFGLQFTIVED